MVCFKTVLSLDTGAALGLVDAIQSILLNPSAPKIKLVNIKVSWHNLSFRYSFIQPHMIERLHTVGLPEEIIIELPSSGNVDNKLFTENQAKTEW